MRIKIVAALLLFFCTSTAHALSPIARFDMIPYQRVVYGQSLNVGVVAFSKPGIASVAFTITSGTATYTGTSPRTVTTMALNAQAESATLTGHSGVWEYYIAIPSSDFSSNGTFTVSAVVTDNGSNTRNLAAITLIAEGASSSTRHFAYVDGTSGNDGTGQADSAINKFQTVAAAVAAAQTANSGSSSGNTIYLENGTYTLGSATVSTSADWLTIQAAPGAIKSSVIVNASGTTRDTALLKMSGLTIQYSSGQFLLTNDPDALWVDDCRVIGGGRYVASSNPVTVSNSWWTRTYIYAVNYGFDQSQSNLVRGCSIEHIGDDAFPNTPFIINSVLTDQDNGTTDWHSDVYQAHTTGVSPANNRIIYGYKATDAHMEGIFLRATSGQATDNAFVNVLVEMSTPCNVNELDQASLVPIAVNESWDHLLIWNSTFLGNRGYFSPSMTNSSVVGNVFWQMANGESPTGWADPGNAAGNDFLHNHYMYVVGLTGDCTPPCDVETCPNVTSDRVDTDASVSSTVGDGILDASFKPLAASSILDRFTSVVPADIDGDARGATSDVGAYELQIYPAHTLGAGPAATIGAGPGFTLE